MRVATPFFGWAVTTLLFTLGGVLTDLSFTTISIVLGILALVSFVYLLLTQQSILDHSFIKLVVITIPLWILISGMVASQWDEFSHWLPSARFLLDHDRFPDSVHSITGASYPAYPYGWPILMYLASRLVGDFVENSGALLNLLVLLTFGLVLLEVARIGLGKPDKEKSKNWMMVALAGLLVTLFNPTFVQKLVLTAYSETSTSVTIALAGILTWMMLDALANKEHRAAMHLAWQSALTLAVHINLRQANLVLFVILIISIIIIGLRDPRISSGALIKRVIILTIPPLVVYTTWRFHVAAHLSGSEFVIRPFDNWFIELIPEILIAMLTVASKKGVYFLIVAVVLVFGIRGLWRMETSLDRLAVLTSGMFLGYNAFLFFTYVAAFGKADALRVASYWRYNIHVGLFASIFCTYGLALVYCRSHFLKVWHKQFGVAAIVILLIAPLIFAKKLRFDHEGRKPYFQMVARDIKAEISEDARYFIVDPQGNGEVGVITKFRTGNSAGYVGVMSAFHPPNVKALNSRLKNSKPEFVLIHSSFDGMDTVFGFPILPDRSYLLKKSASDWVQVRTWIETN
tara:strand:+ start:235 stop:1953 length:1719 start_codon:yes stop_codon:yes gene_type:complete